MTEASQNGRIGLPRPTSSTVGMSSASSVVAATRQNPEISKESTDATQDDLGGVAPGSRLLKTGFMIGTGFAMGVPTSIVGPTMLELKELLGASFEQISWGTTAMCMGVIVGCLSGGILCDKFRPQGDLFVFIAGVMAGVGVALIPWSSSLTIFYLLSTLAGVGTGLTRTAAFTLTNLMWGEKASASIHLVFMGFTCGLITSPVVAIPFLSEEINQYAAIGNTTTVVSTKTDNPEQIRFTFLIPGILMIIMGVPFLVFYLLGLRYSPRKENISLREVLSPDTYSPGRPFFGVVFTTVFFVIFLITYAHASVVVVFLFTVSVDDFGVSKQVSSSLLIGIYATEVLGRIVFGAISKWVRIQVIIMVQLFATSLFAVSFLTIGQKNDYYLWACAFPHQFFSGTLYASFVPWGDRYVEFTGVVTSVSQVALAGGFGAGAAIIGPLYEEYGQASLWYFLIGCCGCMVLLTVPLQVAATRAGERIFQETTPASVSWDTKL